MNLKCHVCGKEKKPYIKFMTGDNILGYIQHEQAREKGEICQKCDNFFIYTGELKSSTAKEYQVAKEGHIFAHRMLAWWLKDKEINPEEEDNSRSWEGTNDISKWYRKEYKNNPILRKTAISHGEKNES